MVMNYRATTILLAVISLLTLDFSVTQVPQALILSEAAPADYFDWK